MRHLDEQLARFGDELKGALGIDREIAAKVATTVAAELRFLPLEAKNKILNESPVGVKDRLSELTAFQAFMDLVSTRPDAHPAVVRAQVLYQNYVCFVYLGEALFKILSKSAPQDSLARKCARFLTDNPVRAFRNAVAHGNWRYRDDFSGLIFWARKGSDPSEPLQEFEVGQQELDFWQTLARGVAYAAYPHLGAGTRK
ncbi:MAG: hypothetical protein ACLQO1_03580 [Steroidobacteraceae bacterium]